MEFLYDKLVQYSMSGYYGFHMPGHKRNEHISEAELPYKIDITEIEGFDDLHHSSGILMECQERAASVFLAEETHYLINGSTVGILCAILGNTVRGDRILMARNCHKSVYNAVFLNELRPAYISPETDNRTGINGPVTRENIEMMLDKFPDTKIVVITSPTYDGVVSDVAGIAECVHRRKIPLIVDEAHGPHFGFHSYFPQNSNQSGADVVIHSLHKTLPSLTQTALLHMNGTLADRQRVCMYLHMLQSSSPSYVLMASMDECVKILEKRGKTLFGHYVDMLQDTREQLKHLNLLKLVETTEYDRSKILIWTGKNTKKKKETKRFTGKELYNILLHKYFLQMEMADPFYVLGMTSPGDTAEGMGRLVSALKYIDGELAEYPGSEGFLSQSMGNINNMQVFSPWEAERKVRAGECNTESVPLEKCAGRIAMEYVYVYPPGIPFIVPGEQISEEIQEQLAIYMKEKFEIRGTRNKQRIEVLKYGQNLLHNG